MKSVNLNPEQRQAVSKMITWFMADKEQFFILSGAGGTGKTTILTELVEQLHEHSRFFADVNQGHPKEREFRNVKVYVSATQNDPVSGLRAAGFTQATTIYSLLGLKLQPDYNGSYRIVTSEDHRAKIDGLVQGKNVVIIDEASHMNHMLYTMLVRYKIRSIFVGDAAQLRSVNKDSVHNDFFIFDYQSHIPSFNLTINNRAQTQTLAEMNQELREAVLAGHQTSILDNGKDVRVLSDDDYKQTLEQYSLKYPEPDQVKVLTFHNYAAHRYNNFCRKVMNKPPYLEVGDVVLANNYYESFKYIDTPSCSYRSSARIPITAVNPTEAHKGLFQHGPFLDDTYMINASGLAVPVYVWKKPSVRKNILADLKEEALKLKKEGAESRAINTAWKTFYAASQNVLDFRYHHSETTHKSQGRTYDWVFIDVPDLLQARVHDTIRRLIYVAFSRAKYGVFIRHHK